MKIKIFLILFIQVAVAYGQDYKDKQKLTFADEAKTRVVIREFLVYNKKEKKYEPYQIELKDFYNYKTNPIGIRYFNFGCVKTKKSGFWLGQVAIDKQRHAIFGEPLYGIRTMILMNTELVENRGNNTLLKFFNVYAPSDDCVGGIKNDDGSCKYGWNQPQKYAKKVGDALGIGINDELKLRNSNGELDTKLMALLISEVAKFETGKDCKFLEETVKKAINLN